MNDTNKGGWPDFKVTDSWSVFKIMAEFVRGYEALAQMGPCISIFGSSRTKPEDPYYHMASELAGILAQNGYGIITGGGPGIMEAANKGAQQMAGTSVGVHIDLPGGIGPNPFIDREHLLHFDYFFVRKVMLIKYSQAFVVFPGGFGTMDELFEALTLIQTEKIQPFPVVLIGKSFWDGLISWLRIQMMNTNGYIDDGHLSHFSICDTAAEAYLIIDEFYKTHKLAPNF